MAERRSDESHSPGTFGESLAAFLDAALTSSEAAEPELRRLVREHLQGEPRTLPVVSLDISAIDHPNLQVALDALFVREGWSADLVGIDADFTTFGGIGIGMVTAPARSAFARASLERGAVKTVSVALDAQHAI